MFPVENDPSGLEFSKRSRSCYTLRQVGSDGVGEVIPRLPGTQAASRDTINRQIFICRILSIAFSRFSGQTLVIDNRETVLFCF